MAFFTFNPAVTCTDCGRRLPSVRSTNLATVVHECEETGNTLRWCVECQEWADEDDGAGIWLPANVFLPFPQTTPTGSRCIHVESAWRCDTETHDLRMCDAHNEYHWDQEVIYYEDLDRELCQAAFDVQYRCCDGCGDAIRLENIRDGYCLNCYEEDDPPPDYDDDYVEDEDEPERVDCTDCGNLPMAERENFVNVDLLTGNRLCDHVAAEHKARSLPVLTLGPEPANA